MSQLNAKRVSAPVTVPVQFDPKPVNPAVSSKLLRDLDTLKQKVSEIGQSLGKDLSSAFSSGHEAVSKMAQRLSEAHAVGKRQAEDSQFVRALLSGGEEHQKEMAERAAKQAEVRGKLLSGTGEFLGKSADFTKRILTGVAGSEEGRAGVKRAFEKIDPIVETAKSGFEAGKSGWELIHNVKELAGWTGTGTATAGAVGAQVAGAGGVGGMLATGASAVAGGTAVASLGLAAEEVTVRIARSLGIIDKNAESTAEAFVGWYKASKEAEKSTKHVALIEQAQQQTMPLANRNDENVAKAEESRSRRIAANVAVAQVADRQSDVVAAADRARQTMATANDTLSGKPSAKTDPLGLNALPPVAKNEMQRQLLSAGVSAARQRIIKAELLNRQAQANSGVQVFDPEEMGPQVARPVGQNSTSTGATEFATLGKQQQGLLVSMFAPQPTKIVSTGAIPQAGAQLSRYEQLGKLQGEITSGAETEFRLLEQRRDVLTQMVGTGKELLQQARDQVATGENARNTRLAQFSTLSKDQQREAADILERIQNGKASRDDLMKLKDWGINQGNIGRTINRDLAKDVDPRLAKLFQQLGGNEDLDEALKRQKEISDALVKTQTNLNDTLGKVDESYKDWLKAQTAQSVTTQQIELIRSRKEGFSENDDDVVAFKLREVMEKVVDNALVPAIREAITSAAAKINNAHT